MNFDITTFYDVLTIDGCDLICNYGATCGTDTTLETMPMLTLGGNSTYYGTSLLTVDLSNKAGYGT